MQKRISMTEKSTAASFRKKIFILSGIISCTAGIVGIFVPILPTTPFLLLAAFLFADSSPCMYRKLCTNEYLGSFIKNYREHCGVPRETIHKALFFLWLTLTVSIYFTGNLWLKITLFAIGCAVTIHLLTLKKSNRPPQKFTLTELLISIGIITIICSMLFPAFNRARTFAAKTLCMNNLKQIGIALHLYAFDYEDILPPLINGLQGSCMVVKMNNIPVGLGHIIGNYGTLAANFGCPLSPVNLPAKVAENWQNKSSVQNAYFYRYNDCGFNPVLSHPENSGKAFLLDFCCFMTGRPIVSHNYEDVNIAYVDGSVIRKKNSPSPGEFFTVAAIINNGIMSTSSESAWENADL